MKRILKAITICAVTSLSAPLAAQEAAPGDTLSAQLPRTQDVARFKLVKSAKEEMRRDSDLARLSLIALGGLERACWPNPFQACGCTLDGFATSCYFVATCLSAGLCELDD
ncbi:hypothetical protein E4Z66_03765 [Aliishimia ponticola]|uniref:Uncharacterized protein n=1 Tax=Aliishimia ponticola TaxID=2499833 RepID=A0A4S4NIY3_9RHOB|nr:hypothetical protein [Aliishimia ponticola]THH38697.1 hypothetical protein E4Z66_03765 [Aliishimia ponticola]